MRALSTALLATVLSVALALSPTAGVSPWSPDETSHPIPAEEVDERPSELEVEEFDRDDAPRRTIVPTTVRRVCTARATPALRRGPGFEAHGLRAPPA